MKNKFILLVLSLCILGFYACNSNKKNDFEKKSKKEHIIPKDTSTEALAGVIEKTPPVENGDYTAKYSNGIVKMKGYYINGKRNGHWMSFFENGKIQSEGFFKSGLRDGKAMVYFENGQIFYTGKYKDGKAIGKWIFYDRIGNKVNEKDYDSL